MIPSNEKDLLRLGAMSFSIDLDDGEEQYIEQIQSLRRQLAQGEYIESVGTLAPQVPTGGTLSFFDVNLSGSIGGSHYRVTLRFRSDNLYLVGWRRPDTNVWYELGHEGGGAAIIRDRGVETQLLTLMENYVDLTRVAGLELDDVPLSVQRIGEALRTLATTEITSRTNLEPVARAVITMAFTIAESSRLRSISDLIHRAWWRESAPGPHYASQVRSWARLSNAVQRTRNEGHTWDFEGDSTNIWSFVDAIRALGIMHLVSTARPHRSVRSVADEDNNSQMATSNTTTWAQGQPLLEIFHVRINNIDSEDPGQLYGTVRVVDSIGTASIWARAQHDYISIKPGDLVLLEGPDRALTAADELSIQLDLWDYDSLSPDDAIAQGTVQFNPFDYYTQYDSTQNRQVNGEYGSVDVSYVAMSDALYAQITVVLINGDDEDPANVYGDIYTNNGYGHSQLFQKGRKEYVNVSPLSRIPLVRGIVAVPTDGSLVITANLWDYDSLSPDDEIAAGEANFDPLYRKSENKQINGAYGKVDVQVTWL
ncbi:unnamed protein product [Clonostachys byssicola]|uniref:DUF6598 domain-containing protein n=1 Tax=Clonostachys byssicola TaxID=160290 RepID=A0A9N9UZK9_9HYPO|nr:unnamed protein product [Clonostachys byssicola]